MFEIIRGCTYDMTDSTSEFYLIKYTARVLISL